MLAHFTSHATANGAATSSAAHNFSSQEVGSLSSVCVIIPAVTAHHSKTFAGMELAIFTRLPAVLAHIHNFINHVAHIDFAFESMLATLAGIPGSFEARNHGAAKEEPTSATSVAALAIFLAGLHLSVSIFVPKNLAASSALSLSNHNLTARLTMCGATA